MKIGIYGGSFDPVHNGHLITAQTVKEMRNLDKIIFIPSYISPHKQNVATSEPKHRVNMLHLAIDKIPHFECSEIELNRASVSYTVDTLRELRKKYDHIEVIIGYDNIFKFHTWREPDEILRLAKLVVLRRKLKSPFIQISGSVIRRRVEENLPINFLVPDNIKDYIIKHKLYKG